MAKTHYVSTLDDRKTECGRKITDNIQVVDDSAATCQWCLQTRISMEREREGALRAHVGVILDQIEFMTKAMKDHVSPEDCPCAEVNAPWDHQTAARVFAGKVGALGCWYCPFCGTSFDDFPLPPAPEE